MKHSTLYLYLFPPSIVIHATPTNKNFVTTKLQLPSRKYYVSKNCPALVNLPWATAQQLYAVEQNESNPKNAKVDRFVLLRAESLSLLYEAN